MAAGLGFKTFTTGEVLTAADTNGYLMQGINVFASTAARDAAITSPQEGQFAFTKDTNGLWYYDGAAWVASGATGDIEGVTAGIGISGGGTSGTVTITNDMATTITASGDIVVGTGSGTYDNLPIGTTGQVLTADTTVSPYKVKWATAAGGGGMTLLSTTTLSGATTSITGISSSYVNLLILIENAGIQTTAGAITINFDSLTTNNFLTSFRSDSTTALNTSSGNIPLSHGQNCDTGVAGNSFAILIYNYANGGTRKPLNFQGNYYSGGWKGIWGGGGYESQGALSTTQIKTSAGTFSGGTVKIYGVN
jgi:hypothetical protein